MSIPAEVPRVMQRLQVYTSSSLKATETRHLAVYAHGQANCMRVHVVWLHFKALPNFSTTK